MHGTPQANFKGDLQHCVQIHRSLRPVVDQEWAAWRRSDIERPAPADLDRLKMTVRWREGIRMQLKSRMSATAQQSDIEERVLQRLHATRGVPYKY